MYVDEVVELVASADVVWSINDRSLATLNGSTLTSFKAGIITVYASYGDLEKTKEITIIEKEKTI